MVLAGTAAADRGWLVIGPLKNFHARGRGRQSNGPAGDELLLQIWPLFGLYLSSMESFFLDPPIPLGWSRFCSRNSAWHILRGFSHQRLKLPRTPLRPRPPIIEIERRPCNRRPLQRAKALPVGQDVHRRPRAGTSTGWRRGRISFSLKRG